MKTIHEIAEELKINIEENVTLEDAGRILEEQKKTSYELKTKEDIENYFLSDEDITDKITISEDEDIEEYNQLRADVVHELISNL